MRYEESVYKSLEETRREQLNQAEILYYRNINAEIMIIQSVLQKLSAFVSQCFDDAPQSARGSLDYSELASKYSDDQPRDDLGRFALVGGSGSPGKGELNIDAAVKHLTDNAKDHPPLKGEGKCAIYVRVAVEKGGVKLNPPEPRDAYQYRPYLKKHFEDITPTELADYSPKTGDIVVFDRRRPELPSGHIQMYNGTQWVSDFKQKGKFWPGITYEEIKPSYSIYRPRDWKPKPENV